MRSTAAIRIAAPQRQRFVRGLEIGIANRVEHDVGALAAGQFANACRDIGGGSVDHLDRRIGVTFIGLAPADDADDAGAVPARDLRHRPTDLAVDAQDQHGVVRLRNAGAAEAFHRGDEGPADAGGSFPRKILGLFDQRLGLDIRCVAWVPSRRMPRSPDEPNTSRPTQSAGPSITTPAKSRPGVRGNTA